MRGCESEGEEVGGSEIAIADRVEAIGGDAGERELPGDGVAIDGKRGAGQCARAEDAGIGLARGIGDTFGIAEKGFGVGEREMGKEDGLRRLHVGEAGHDGGLVAAGETDEGAKESGEGGARFAGGFAEIKAQVRGDLLIAAAAGVELGAEFSGAGDERGLDEAMHVLGVGSQYARGIGLDGTADFVESGANRLRFRAGQYSCGGESGSPSAARGNFLGEERSVESE